MGRSQPKDLREQLKSWQLWRPFEAPSEEAFRDWLDHFTQKLQPKHQTFRAAKLSDLGASACPGGSGQYAELEELVGLAGEVKS